jgi:hypothetical protein
LAPCRCRPGGAHGAVHRRRRRQPDHGVAAVSDSPDRAQGAQSVCWLLVAAAQLLEIFEPLSCSSPAA